MILSKQIYFPTDDDITFRSLREAFVSYGIELVPAHLEVQSVLSENIMAVARGKVVHAFDRLKKPCVAVESEFYLDAIPGFPGVHTNAALEKLGLEGILDKIDGGPRGCSFRHCLAYIDRTGTEPNYFESEARGRLSERPQGILKPEHWSPLFKIFIPEGCNDTLAELSDKEYARWNIVMAKESFLAKFAAWLVHK